MYSDTVQKFSFSLRKTLTFVAGVVLALVFSAGIALAATLQVTSIGGISTGTGTLETFETIQTSPTFVGTASIDATVNIKIDDLTVATTANPAGAWSHTPTNLSVGNHAVEITSNLETVSFTLTIKAAESTATQSTTTKGGVSTTSAELPKSGAFENTVLVIVAGMFLIGSGLVAHHALPASDRE